MANWADQKGYQETCYNWAGLQDARKFEHLNQKEFIELTDDSQQEDKDESISEDDGF